MKLRTWIIAAGLALLALAAAVRADAPAGTQYFLGPWVWHSDGDEEYWKAPKGTIGLIDLRPLRNTDTYGFFAVLGESETLALKENQDYLYLGGDLNKQISDRKAWETKLGIEAGSITGATMLDVLAETLTTDADPTGDTHALPLMPTHDGEMEIHLGGHSKVWSRPWTGKTDPAYDKVMAVVQNSVREIRGEVTERPTKAEQDRATLAGKYSQAMADKLKISTDDVIPDDLKSAITARKPTTTITDDFNRADQSGLGTSAEGWSWTRTGGSGETIASNQASLNGTTQRAQIDLSSTDHCAKALHVTSGNSYLGPMVRFSSSAVTGYFSGSGRYILSHWKVVGGTRTVLNTDERNTGNDNPILLSLSADGSTLLIEDFTNSDTSSITDTSIAEGARVGI